MEIKENMLKSRFGIEIEMTGITREKAATIVAETINGTKHYIGGFYGTWEVKQQDGRKWSIVSDASIVRQKGNVRTNDSNYAVELVSPILTYREDMEKLQEIVRALRKGGAISKAELQCGIHIHLDGEPHTPLSIRNFINIIASKNDLLYKALQIKPERMRWCKKMDDNLVRRIKTRRPKTKEAIKKIWYEGYGGFEETHYHTINQA